MIASHERVRASGGDYLTRGLAATTTDKGVAMVDLNVEQLRKRERGRGAGDLEFEGVRGEGERAKIGPGGELSLRVKGVQTDQIGGGRGSRD